MTPLDDWLTRAESRETLVTPDGKSGALLERLVIDGAPYVIKHLRPADDWIMRVTDDDGTWFLRLWESGTLSQVPSVIDPVVVDVVPVPGGSVIVMHDIGEYLVPEGGSVVDLDQHRRFIEHIASLHAQFWGWEDTLGLLDLERRYTWFSPAFMRPEAARPGAAVVPGLAVEGWERLPTVAPDMARIVFDLHDHPAPLIAALNARPQTLVHGDVKMGNLGSRPNGATIMIDWALPGRAPGGYDLAHYLALNSDRLPEPKEAVIDAYRRALEAAGCSTADWFEDQVGLCLIGHMMLLGWEKALGGPGAELSWWEDRVVAAAELLA